MALPDNAPEKAHGVAIRPLPELEQPGFGLAEQRPADGLSALSAAKNAAAAARRGRVLGQAPELLRLRCLAVHRRTVDVAYSEMPPRKSPGFTAVWPAPVQA